MNRNINRKDYAHGPELLLQITLQSRTHLGGSGDVGTLDYVRICGLTFGV